MVTFAIDEEVQEIQKTVHEFVEEHFRGAMREAEEARGAPEEVLQQVAELGFLTADYPDDLGGLGLDLRAAVVVQEELGWGDLGITAALTGPGFAGYALLDLAAADQRKRLLEPFTTGWRRTGAVALTEKGDPVDPDFIQTTWKGAGGGYQISGEKTFVFHGGRADLYIVLAREEGGAGWGALRAFAVPGSAKGLSAGPRHATLGLETALLADVTFANVSVPKENLLAGGADFRASLEKFLDRCRVITAARMVGAMRAACEYAAKYSTERQAFGVPIKDHQSIAFMVADMATDVDGCRWNVWRAADAFVRGSRRAANVAAVALSHVVDRAQQVATDAVQVLGGHGYIKDHPVEKWMRDLRTMALAPGCDLFPSHAVSAAWEG
ncbi:MAG: acyl-CoA dehydrogenase family protein [Planctomycetes bacterium]|nr:acyl-CoA dehydrogenase family protein [Planctomycetota bacterium]